MAKITGWRRDGPLILSVEITGANHQRTGGGRNDVVATGRASDGSENPNLRKHHTCDTVIETESADLSLGPAVSEPHQEAGEMTATDHRAKAKKSSWQAGD